LKGLEPDFDLVIPVTSEWARFIASIDPIELPENLIFQGDNFEKLDNKEIFCAALGELSIRTPAILNKLETISNTKVVVKPVFGASSKGVMYFESSKSNWKELKNFRNSTTHVIQEFINGFGAGVSGFCINGRSYSVYCHKRLMEWPMRGGSSTYRESFQNQELELAFSKVAKQFKWTGFLMLEAKIDRDGRPWIIEANPRIWGSFRQSVENTSILSELIKIEYCDSMRHENRTFHNPLGYLSAIINLFIRPGTSLKFILDVKKKPDVSLFLDPKGWLSQFGR
jgi:predicted ATP-grasp superfamily ATP-dependent carboligase